MEQTNQVSEVFISYCEYLLEYIETNLSWRSRFLLKDLVLFLTENDLLQCPHPSQPKPIYEIREKQSICDIIINGIITSACIQKQSTCENKWIKLRRPNDWLYQCCQQCTDAHLREILSRFTLTKTSSITWTIIQNLRDGAS
ncbi:hypothetical protein HW555_013675 [Spodoptera exigua]|uniref:Uncharacterized protein n=1 Tax=Spodoptera exigua TaxID=7107 RepID=A0A835G491_SPOEX|nr:hypothetical protein HW555_013675 [Spodoptera exigua]